MTKSTSTWNQFVQEIIYPLLKSDRDVVIAFAGFTGEGKSVSSTQCAKSYCKVTNQKFTFDRMTWSRKELMRWIDGEGKEKEGQLPEYSYIIPDELIAMFFGRSWYEDAQKESIRVFNTCRDRHLLVMGSVPNFWELDSGFRDRVRFYVFIPERGVAWVFQQEVNPFVKDPWNVAENVKLFRKHKNPYKSPNFIVEIKYDDLTAEEKEEYQAIRNNKRGMINEDSRDKAEKYSTLKATRDKLVKALLVAKPELTQKEVAEMSGISEALVSMIKNGLV